MTRHRPPPTPAPLPEAAMTTTQMIERLTQMNNNLAMQVEEFTAGRMTESMSDLDWANRVDRDYLWIRASGANAPQFRYMTKETIDMYADIANFMYVYNPLINRIVTVKTSFTFALDYSITAKDPESDIGKQIDALKKDKLNRQAIFTHKAITEIDSELLRTGNVFLAVWKDKDPVQIRPWSNYEIRQVVTDKDDANRPLFYIRQWLDDSGTEHTKAYPSMFATDKDIPGGKMQLNYLCTTYEIDRSVVVYHVCSKKPLKSKFALTELVAPCRWAKPHEKFLEDFGAIATAVRKITAMMITKGGAGQVSAISAQMKGDTNYMGTPLQSNPAGSMIVAQEGNEYRVVDAGSGKIVGPADSRYFLLMVSAASGVPETYLTMDPSTGNLATAKEISPIFITLIQERQTAWKEAFTDIFGYILESDEFEVSFPPIRDNLQAYVNAVNAFARDAQGNWTGALRGEDYVKAAHEALEWKLPDKETIDAMAAALEASGGMPAEPPGMGAGLDAIAQAANGLMEAVRQREADEGQWTTINGVHILIKDGETTADAFKRTTGKDLSAGSGGGGGSSGPGTGGGGNEKKPDFGFNNKDGILDNFGEPNDVMLKRISSEYKSIKANEPKFNDGEKTAISKYCGDTESFEINTSLRHGDPSSHIDQINNLKTAIDKAPPLPSGIITYRGVRGKNTDVVKSIEIGDIISDKGFQSTTLDPVIAIGFSRMPVTEGGERRSDLTMIRQISSNRVKAITGAKDEKEIIFKPETSWKVTDINSYPKGDGDYSLKLITVRDV